VPIAVGDVVTGAIDASGEVRYLFEAASGDEISVLMEVLDGNLDPFLVLYDAEGNQLAVNDDRDGTTRNSQIGPFTLPADGQYLIVATRFQRELGSTLGNFRLTLTAGALSPSGTGQTDEDTVLSYGDSVEATLNSETWNRTYTFEAEEGDVITITLVNVDGTLDPLLQLKDADGVIVAESDDIASDNRDSEINAFVIPADGIYTIVASRFMQAEGDSEGEFMLTLDRTQGSGA
jgi:hypothetical protein